MAMMLLDYSRDLYENEKIYSVLAKIGVILEFSNARD